MKTKLIKLLALTLALLILALPLIGCNGESTDGPQESDESTDSSEAPTDETTGSESESQTEERTEAETEDPYVYEPHTYSTLEHLDRIKVTGRSVATSTGITADWSGSGIEFRAHCKGNVKINITSSHAITFKVYVDDNKPTAVTVAAGTRSHIFAMGLDGGEHTIRIVKQEAVESGNTAVLASINSIELTGDLLDRPADAPYLIEFIGDSITCGVGSLAKDAPNAPGSYAYLAAERLGVDYSMVSISGIGLIRSTGRHNGLTMLKAYALNNRYRNTEQKYTPTRQADIVVVNLNTNDKNSMSADKETEYKNAARELLRQIREIHGADVKIVWVYGMMKNYHSGYCDIWADEVLAELGGEAAGYYSRILPTNTNGVSSHPNTKGHQNAANVLCDFLQMKGLIPAQE